MPHPVVTALVFVFERYILSDFVIRPEQVLVGALPVTQSLPGQLQGPILTMYSTMSPHAR